MDRTRAADASIDDIDHDVVAVMLLAHGCAGRNDEFGAPVAAGNAQDVARPMGCRSDTGDVVELDGDVVPILRQVVPALRRHIEHHTAEIRMGADAN